MAVTIQFRKTYRCDTEAERDLSWGEESLIYTADTDKYYKILDGSYVEVPLSEIFFTSPIPFNKLAISGVPDGTKFVRDDGSLAVPSGNSGSSSTGGIRTSLMLMGG